MTSDYSIDNGAMRQDLDRVLSRPEPTKFPFGQHKGKPLADIPTGYLLWALGKCKLGSGLRESIEQEIKTREISLDFGKFKGVPLADVPSWYLLWVLSNCDKICSRLREAIEDVLQ